MPAPGPGPSHFPCQRMFRCQAETICKVGHRICRIDLRNDSGHMGTAIREGVHVSARRRGRLLENRRSDFSSFDDIGQGEQTDPDAEKTLHPSKNELTAGDSGPTCCCPESSGSCAERALIDRILSGHKELFMDLIHPHERTVYATVFSLLANKEDAEDVTQETLLKGLARLNQFRRESTFGTWLIQIAINEARMRNRKQWRVRMFSLNGDNRNKNEYVPKDFEDWREIPSAALERAEIREALVKALGSLERHYREAFVMRDIHGLSISETSAVLGISSGAVKTRLRRARLMLRDILAHGLGQDGRLGCVSNEVRNPWE